jgi:hypothetical protein
MNRPAPGPVPAQAGIGLRAPHHAELIASAPDVGWVEVHSENFFAAGGSSLVVLERVRDRYPLSLHGVGLSLGSADALDEDHVSSLARLVDRIEPALVSEHVCWSAIGGRHTNDLLPMPFTREALRHLEQRVQHVQERIGRRILLENVSSYIEFEDAEYTEWDFIAELARRAGCGVLLDVNNVYVNAMNHGFDADAFLAGMPPEAVEEIHLAGHLVQEIAGATIRIDTHDRPVCDAVWRLYDRALARFGPIPTLIEWDARLPALETLVADAHAADARLRKHHAVAA